MEALTPIDEEPSEDNNGDEDQDQPITMIPRIMHTAPSPTTENPLSTITSTSTIQPEKQPVEAHATNNSNNNKAPATPTKSTTNGKVTDKEISQIESVL